jgi:hypothetical protein
MLEQQPTPTSSAFGVPEQDRLSAANDLAATDDQQSIFTVTSSSRSFFTVISSSRTWNPGGLMAPIFLDSSLSGQRRACDNVALQVAQLGSYAIGFV